MNRSGFTLIEILVVITIAGILMAIAIPQYGLMMRRKGMEREIREIQSDISSFRLSAIHRKEQRRIVIGPRLLHFQRLNVPLLPALPFWEPALNAAPPAGSGVPPARFLPYEVRRTSNGVLAPFTAPAGLNGDWIEFDDRGNASVSINNIVYFDSVVNFPLNQEFAIVVTPVDTGMGESCIVVDRGRNNIGRMVNANTCQVR